MYLIKGDNKCKVPLTADKQQQGLSNQAVSIYPSGITAQDRDRVPCAKLQEGEWDLCPGPLN